MTDRCSIRRCRQDGDVLYLGRWICSKHWEKYADSKEKLVKFLDVKEAKCSRR